MDLRVGPVLNLDNCLFFMIMYGVIDKMIMGVYSIFAIERSFHACLTKSPHAMFTLIANHG